MGMKKAAFLAIMVFYTCGLMAQSGSQTNSDIVFKDSKMELAYNNYIRLKDALVASKSVEAKDAAAKLKTSLASVKDPHPDSRRDAMKEAAKIASASAIDDIRK